MVGPKNNSGLQQTSARVEDTSTLRRLREFIENGNYKPGMRLPPERVLARELEVGRPAIREAIKALSILDVLSSRRGDGTYVNSTAGLAPRSRATIQVGNFSMLALLELRKVFEPRAAGWAAARAREADLKTIQRLGVALDRSAIDWPEIVRLDYDFHSAIIHAAGNPILEDLHGYLSPILVRSREATAKSIGNWKQLRGDHRRIAEAILRGESAASEQAMLEHLHHIGLDLIAEVKL